jgi:hypothetical protein
MHRNTKFRQSVKNILQLQSFSVLGSETGPRLSCWQNDLCSVVDILPYS